MPGVGAMERGYMKGGHFFEAVNRMVVGSICDREVGRKAIAEVACACIYVGLGDRR